MLGTAEEERTNSSVTFFQQRLTVISSVRTLDTVLRTYQAQWLIETDGERKSKESVPSACLLINGIICTGGEMILSLCYSSIFQKNIPKADINLAIIPTFIHSIWILFKLEPFFSDKSRKYSSTLFSYSLNKYRVDKYLNALSAGLRICWLYPLQRDKTPPPKKRAFFLYDIKLNGKYSSSGDPGSVAYLFIMISSWPTLTGIGNTC